MLKLRVLGSSISKPYGRKMGKFTFFIAACAALFTFIQTATAVDNGNLKKLDDLDQLYVSSKPFELSNPDAFFNYRRDILKNGFY